MPKSCPSGNADVGARHGPERLYLERTVLTMKRSKEEANRFSIFSPHARAWAVRLARVAHGRPGMRGAGAQTDAGEKASFGACLGASRTHWCIRHFREIGSRRTRKRAATVYRALNFLISAGLVHRIDSLNAYFGCEAPRTDHAAQFLVCRSCHSVAELGDPAISRLLARRVKAAGFVADAPDVEIKGLCGSCRTAANTPVAVSAP